MKITFLSASLSRRGGGLFEVEWALAQQLVRDGVEVEALGLEDEGWPDDRYRWEPVAAEVFPVCGPKAFGYSGGLRDRVRHGNADLLHLHGLWTYPSLLVASHGRMTGKPYLVSPHGMLDPWALAHSSGKKWIAGHLHERRMLGRASCLHALCDSERNAIRAYGLNTPVCIIPNGVSLPSADTTRDSEEGRGKPRGRKTLLFLGRLHPKKGLVNALKAWSEVMRRGAEREDWQFVIAGWDQGAHVEELKTLCRELHLSYAESSASEFLQQSPECSPAASVIFTGPAFGEEKDVLLRRADTFILPSFSEGLPMAVLEAWAYHLTVLMTDACNLPEGFAADAAVKIATNETAIAEGLRTLFGMSDDERQTMGEAGRRLVEERFTWPKVAAQMKEVYEWILGGGTKPGCLF